MPFLVDSLAVVLGDSRLPIQLMIHPVLRIARDRRGKLLSMEEHDGALGTMESWQHVAVPRIGDPARHEALTQNILRMLEDVRLAVADWPAIRQAGSGHRQGRECRRASHSPSRGKRSGRVHRVARRQPLHVPRLPRIQARAHPLGRSPGTGASFRPGPAAHGRRPSAAQADGAHRRTAAQGARSRAADRDQGQLRLHRAPRDLPRLRRHQDVRQGRSRRRRATLHRPVHVEHLQHQSARDSRCCATRCSASWTTSACHRRVTTASR